MKIFIIGSTHYESMMRTHAQKMIELGHEVLLPFFDADLDDELQICQTNIDYIREADEVHLFWNQRTTGTVLDVGACLALNKPLKVIYMEEKTLRGVIEKYEASFK